MAARDLLTSHYCGSLGSITDTAQKLANLDFMTVCDIQSNDELGSLSNSLNTLASNLQNALDELNKATNS